MAAWELVKDEKEPGFLDLTVVNPTLVIGPSLTKNVGTSIDICTQILMRKMSATPYLCMNVVDVRDVAEGIVRSMVSLRSVFFMTLPDLCRRYLEVGQLRKGD